jgi:hypothetical protein
MIPHAVDGLRAAGCWCQEDWTAPASPDTRQFPQFPRPNRRRACPFEDKADSVSAATGETEFRPRSAEERCAHRNRRRSWFHERRRCDQDDADHDVEWSAPERLRHHEQVRRHRPRHRWRRGRRLGRHLDAAGGDGRGRGPQLLLVLGGLAVLVNRLDERGDVFGLIGLLHGRGMVRFPGMAARGCQALPLPWRAGLCRARPIGYSCSAFPAASGLVLSKLRAIPRCGHPTASAAYP